MNRPLVILLAALVLGAAIFAGSYTVGQRACNIMSSTDDLSWLRNEFHLSDADMARVRHLHEDYMPQCAAMCAKLAAKKAEVTAALTNGSNVSVEAQKQLTELGELRAQCQGQMLQHFINVSHAMPPEAGRRYLAEMERMTIGFHEDIEQTMSPSAHGNH